MTKWPSPPGSCPPPPTEEAKTYERERKRAERRWWYETPERREAYRFKVRTQKRRERTADPLRVRIAQIQSQLDSINRRWRRGRTLTADTVSALSTAFVNVRLWLWGSRGYYYKERGDLKGVERVARKARRFMLLMRATHRVEIEVHLAAALVLGDERGVEGFAWQLEDDERERQRLQQYDESAAKAFGAAYRAERRRMIRGARDYLKGRGLTPEERNELNNPEERNKFYLILARFLELSRGSPRDVSAWVDDATAMRVRQRLDALEREVLGVAGADQMTTRGTKP